MAIQLCLVWNHLFVVVLQSVVIIVVPRCQAHIVGGTTILPSFAMCGQVAAIRSGDNLAGLSLSV